MEKAENTENSDISGDKVERRLEDRLGDVHENILPTRKLIICFLAMAMALLVCFMDQTGVTVALPFISESLNAGNTINWAGTSSLMANCVCQVLFGRFADIFGRKSVLLASMVLLCVANMLCGFAQTGVQFYVFRAFAGIGSGGAQSLGMVIVSDVVTLKQRGKYQGILGSFIGLGNVVGPIAMAGFAESGTWRNFYRMMPPLIAVVVVVVWVVIEDRRSQLNSVLPKREKLRKIDYFGLLFATAGLTLLLVPISGGGSTYRWDSGLVIGMFVAGGVSLLAFLLAEWKTELPLIPLYIFRSPGLDFLLVATFLYGIAHFGFLFIVSYYYELVRAETALQSAYLLIPLVLTQAATSSLAGSIISYTGHFKPVLISGYAFWLTGVGMTVAWHKNTSVGQIVGTLLVMGIGVGFIFQPTMVAVQANATKAQRAVVIGTRNVLRAFGGALGTALSGLIISNSILRNLPAQSGNLPADFLIKWRSHIYARPDLSQLSSAQEDIVRTLYMGALRNVFYFEIPLLSLCFILSFFVKDRGLRCLDEQQVDTDIFTTKFWRWPKMYGWSNSAMSKANGQKSNEEN